MLESYTNGHTNKSCLSWCSFVAYDGIIIITAAAVVDVVSALLVLFSS
jgi:hypothetical protein